MAKLVHGQPWGALAAYQRVMNHQNLTTPDVEALLELVIVHEGDSREQRKGRELLFMWIWRELEPGTDRYM
jgi:hypothetical protein